MRIELLGRDIQHSASPGMWQRIYAETSTPATYGLRDVAEEELDDALDDLRSGAVDRFHITMPYKQWAFDVAENYGDDVRLTGVANGLTFDDGAVTAVNTDVGAARALLDELPGPPRTVLVVGAGATGASLTRAVLEVAAEVAVTNRAPERSRALADRDWSAPVQQVDWQDREEYAADVDLLVNTTPCGLRTSSSPLPGWEPGPDALLYDLIYGPEPTALQLQAARGGARIVDGLSHLQAHAEVSLRAMGWRQPPTETLRRIMSDVTGRAPLRWERLALDA